MTPQTPSDEARELIDALRPFMPISTHDTPDYAEVTFGGHQTQAMTMHPTDWQRLNSAYEAALTPAEPLSRETVEQIQKAIHENGPICLDFMGEDLAWRPLDYGTWTTLSSSPPSTEPVEGEQGR